MEQYLTQRIVVGRDTVRSNREFERKAISQAQQRQNNKTRYVFAEQREPIRVIYDSSRYYDPVWARKGHEWMIQVRQGEKSRKGIIAKVDNESKTLDVILANGTELNLSFDPEGPEPDLLPL